MTVAALLALALTELAKVSPKRGTNTALKRAKARIKEAQAFSGQAAANRLGTALTELAKVKVGDTASNAALDAGKQAVRDAKAQIEAPSSPPLAIEWGAWMNALPGQTGNAPWSKETWDGFEADAGKPVGLCHWGQPWGMLDLTALAIVKSRGAVSLIDHGIGMTTLRAVAVGEEDAVITAWAQKAASFGERIMYRPWWEFNGAWYSWGRSPDFIAAWRRMHGIVKAIAPAVEFVWCANVFWDAASEAPLYAHDTAHPAGMYPGDAYVDWLGMDGYNFASLKGQPWTPPLTLFGPTYKRLTTLAPDKRLIVCETGCTERDGDKALWIRDLLRTALPQDFPAIRAFCWFNWPIIENGILHDWPIESSAAAQEAFREEIAAERYR